MKKNKKIVNFLPLLILTLPEIAHATEYITCGDNKRFPLVLAQLISTFMNIIKIVVPILLVISGMISFLKVTFSSNVEEEMKKAKSKLINNIIAAVVIFFIISIVNFAVSLVAGSNSNIMSCVNCLINPDKCEQVDENGKKLCPGFIDQEYDENCNPIDSETNNQNTNNSSNKTSLMEDLSKDFERINKKINPGGAVGSFIGNAIFD